MLVKDDVEKVHSINSGVVGSPLVGLMTLEKFADSVGLPHGVVLGFLNKGYLPTVTLGRRRLINVAALQRECSRKEFAL